MSLHHLGHGDRSAWSRWPECHSALHGRCGFPSFPLRGLRRSMLVPIIPSLSLVFDLVGTETPTRLLVFENWFGCFTAVPMSLCASPAHQCSEAPDGYSGCYALCLPWVPAVDGLHIRKSRLLTSHASTKSTYRRGPSSSQVIEILGLLVFLGIYAINMKFMWGKRSKWKYAVEPW